MASKAVVIAFEKTNKASIKGRVGHSRTGACTAQGRCYHGWIHQAGLRGRKKKK